MIYERYKWSHLSPLTVCIVQACLRIMFFFYYYYYGKKNSEDQRGSLTSSNDVTLYTVSIWMVHASCGVWNFPLSVFKLDFEIFRTIASFIKISSGHFFIIKIIIIKFFRIIWEIGGQTSWDRCLAESLPYFFLLLN